MFLTEQEIMDTPNALKRTYQLFNEKQDNINAFFTENKQRKFTFLGCGSSYMLAKSGAAIFGTFENTSASAIPAGDYIVNPDFWKTTVNESILVSISRSGRTSEMVRAIKHIQQLYGCPVISLSMEAENDISPMSSLELIMDWCYDRSVCQTRTVTNLYTAVLLLASAYDHDNTLAASIERAAFDNERFQQENRPLLEVIAAMDWNNVTVLADGPVCGIAEEAALAFTEISMLSGRYFHFLDFRHGPIVINDEKSLTVILVNPAEDSLQADMVADVISHGGPVITVSKHAENIYNSTAHIQIAGIEDFAAWGIPFIYIAQMTAFLKAVASGGNPDAPKGLNAFITLK